MTRNKISRQRGYCKFCKIIVIKMSIEITSTGGLTDDLSREEFFQGFSVPRNQEIMRIFKDLELVEYLGLVIPRILQAYPEKSFHFTENFLRMTFPNAWNLAEDEVTPEAPPSRTIDNCIT